MEDSRSFGGGTGFGPDDPLGPKYSIVNGGGISAPCPRGGSIVVDCSESESANSAMVLYFFDNGLFNLNDETTFCPDEGGGLVRNSAGIGGPISSTSSSSEEEGRFLLLNS